VAGRTWVLGSRARTAVGGICVRPQAVVRASFVRRTTVLVKDEL